MPGFDYFRDFAGQIRPDTWKFREVFAEQINHNCGHWAITEENLGRRQDVGGPSNGILICIKNSHERAR